MLDRQELLALLEEALELTRSAGTPQYEFSPELVLLGEGGILDSLDTMVFLSNVEDMLQKHTHRKVDVVTPESFSREESPFSTVEGLASFIEELFKEREAARPE